MWGQRLEEIMDRLMGLIKKAFPLITEEQGEQVCDGMVQALELEKGPYGGWLLHLSRGWCRLPELTPEASKDVLLTWLLPDVDGGQICQQCGMEYPIRRHPPLSLWYAHPWKGPPEGVKPEFFENCPSCGASRCEMDWPHLIEDKQYPWMELDGYMGIDSSRKNRFR
jgi:hypothetical protein